jgi:hypothetical protein
VLNDFLMNGQKEDQGSSHIFVDIKKKNPCKIYLRNNLDYHFGLLDRTFLFPQKKVNELQSSEKAKC